MTLLFKATVAGNGLIFRAVLSGSRQTQSKSKFATSAALVKQVIHGMTYTYNSKRSSGNVLILQTASLHSEQLEVYPPLMILHFFLVHRLKVYFANRTARDL